MGLSTWYLDKHGNLRTTDTDGNVIAFNLFPPNPNPPDPDDPQPPPPPEENTDPAKPSPTGGGGGGADGGAENMRALMWAGFSIAVGALLGLVLGLRQRAIIALRLMLSTRRGMPPGLVRSIGRLRGDFTLIE